MFDWSYEFSFSDVVNGTIGALLFLLAVTAAGYVWRRVSKYIWASRNARRKLNYITIWKRIKSDEFFASRQQNEVILVIVGFSLAILSFQVYVYEAADGELDIVEALTILFVVLACAIVFGTLNWEGACNSKALLYRMRIERKKKKPPRRRARARKIIQPSAGAAPHMLRGEAGTR